MEWSRIFELIVAGDVGGVVAAQRGLPEAARKQLAGPFRQFERVADQDFGLVDRPRAAATVAGAALLPPRALAAFFSGWDGLLRLGEDADFLPVAEVLLERRLRGLPTILLRVAGQLFDGGDTRYRLVDLLVRRTPCDPPQTGAFAVCWLEDRLALAADDVRSGPAWRRLLALALETDRLGALLDARPQLRQAVLGLVDAGLVHRDDLLDSSLAALQRDGSAGWLGWHDTLELTVDEVRARSRQYLSLLTHGRTAAAATVAQRQLRGLDRAGLLGLDEALAAGRAGLARSEKGVIRAQLNWLEKLAVREPNRRAEVLAVMSGGLDQATSDVCAETLASLGRFAADLGEPLRAALLAKAPELPAAVQAELGALLGVPAGSAAVTTSMVAPAAEEFLPPIASAAELAECVMQFVAGQTAGVDARAVERILACYVRLGWEDPAALDEVVLPALRQGEHWLRPGVEDLTLVGAQLHDMFWAVLHTSVSRRPQRSDFVLDRLEDQLRFAGPPSVAAPDGVQARRFAEIAAGMSYWPQPCLLATPTSADGFLDPDELVRRLDLVDVTGHRPWPHDLTQALLRVPADGYPVVHAAVARRSGLSARAVLGWLDALQPLEVRVQRWTPATRPGRDHPRTTSAVLLTMTPTAWPPMPTPEIWATLWTLEQGADTHWSPYRWSTTWPGMLPGDREVIAVHLVRDLFLRTDSGRGLGPVLLGLAQGRGRVGIGLRLALAYGMAASDPADRAAAADALITLIARDELDGAALGADLGEIVARRAVPLSRVASTMADVGRAGGWQMVWQVLAGTLGCLVEPGDTPLNGLPDLLALAVEAAHVIRPATVLPGLDGLADRPGSSRVRTEARRLRAALSPGP